MSTSFLKSRLKKGPSVTTFWDEKSPQDNARGDGISKEGNFAYQANKG